MFAVIDIAGFQEKVEEGMKLKVPLLNAEEGAKVTFDKVFLVSKGEGEVTVGTPLVAGASVEAKVLGAGRGEKIRVYKMRRRKRYHRVKGHRQDFVEIEVTKISTK